MGRSIHGSTRIIIFPDSALARFWIEQEFLARQAMSSQQAGRSVGKGPHDFPMALRVQTNLGNGSRGSSK